MPANDKILDHCRNLVSQPDYRKEYLLRLKDQCRGLIGYFSNYIPEEIIAAAGFHPVRIIGSFDTSQSHQRTLFNPACSFVQDVYAAACCGEFSLFTHVIFPNSCDSLKLLRQMWESEVKTPSAYTVFHPINADADSIRYFAEECKRFADELKSISGVNFTEADLTEKINQYNQTRSLLRKLSEIKTEIRAFLSGSQFITLLTAGLIMDRNEYNQILEQLIQEGTDQQFQDDKSKKKIMIIGPLMDNIRLLEQIEQSGAMIIDDDITNGTRYFDLDVRTQGDLYINLAERYLRSGPSPTLHTDPRMDIQSFQDRVSGLDMDGVVFVNQKFCEPHVHNYLSKIEILKKLKINYLMLEIEHDRAALSERDLLRIESFIEIAGRNSIGVE